MRKNHILAQGAVLAALYVVLTHFQNLLLPGSGSFAVQLRVSEGLCVLALFTPGAAPGLALGCLIFNLTFSSALPLDFLVGAAATWLACSLMYRLRRLWPLALAFPVLCNAVLVGWELSVYMGGGFLLNAGYVALGEAIIMYGLGVPLYLAIRKRKLDRQLFSKE